MEQLADNVFVETEYEGVNVGAILTKQGIIAIDAPSYPRQARDWAMRLHALSPRPLQYLILTDYDGDRILNARWLNAPIVTHQVTRDRLADYEKRYPAALLESLANRNPEKGRELRTSPVEHASISFDGRMEICKGTQRLVLIAAPGPTSANIWVYHPQSAVLFAGDTVIDGLPPLLKEPTGRRWQLTLSRLQTWSEPLERIVPGRGTVCDNMERVRQLAQTLADMQARIEQLVANEQPREETAIYAAELLTQYNNHQLPTDWLKKQLKSSLDRLYDELKLGDNRP